MSEQLAHSAEVQMRLLLNGSTFAITHMGPDYLRLRQPIEHPAGPAQIVLTIDGNESRWEVFLPQGIPTGGQPVAVTKIDP